MCVFFFLLFSSVTKDEHLVADQRGKKGKKTNRVDFIEESDFAVFLLVAPGAGS